MNQPTRRPFRGAVATVALVLTASGLASGCSGDDDPEPKSSPSSSSAATPAGVTTAVTIGKLTGGLPAAARAEVAADVQKVVDGWFEAAYLGGDYPRSDFSQAWPGFTAGARAQARRDAALTSNSDLGPKIDGVEPVKRVLRLEVLSSRKKPVGVTARVILRFRTTGTVAEDVRVAGRLYLTPVEDGGRVFGYDITKGTA